MHKKWDVYVYGDVNMDIVIPGVLQFPKPGQEDEVSVMKSFIGGGAALFAMGLGKLGTAVAFQGAVGDDCYGDFIRKEFKKNHVDDSLILTNHMKKTGISLCFTNEKDRSFLTYRGTNEDICMEAVDVERIKEATHFHTTYSGSVNHGSYLKTLQKIKEETTATISLDVGWDATGEWNPNIYQLFPVVDVLFMNETESINYTHTANAEAAIKELSKHCKIAVVKMGKKGAMAVCGDTLCHEPAYTVEAIDTTGAGDSFNAGFIYGFLKGLEPKECLRYGNACGAMSVTALGGNTAFPTKDRLKNFMSQVRF